MNPTEGTVDVRGLKIHYVEWGKRTDEPLILVHGFLDHCRSWDRFVAAIQRISPHPLWIVAPDCRGHGDSGWVGSGGYYHFPDYVLDLDCLVRTLGASSASLIGHSMGGTICFLYTGTFPKRVRRLVLVEGVGPPALEFSDAPPRMEKWISEVKSAPDKEITGYSTLEEAATRLRRQNPRLTPEHALHLARYGMKLTESHRWIWKFDPLHRTRSPQPFYSGQAIEFFRRIECPVLIVRGKDSRQTPRPDIQERLESIARRSVVEIGDAGHMIHHDNPRALAEIVVKFLD